MKKRAILLAAVAAMLLFSGCAVSEENARQLYKDAFAKTTEMERYTLDSTAEMTLDFSGLAVDMTMEMHSDVQNKGQTAAHEMTISSMGQEQEMSMYQQGEFLYTEIPGTEQYLVQSYEESTGLSYQGLMALSSDAMSQNYIDAIDSGENFVFAELEDKSVNVNFDFSEESRNAIVGGITDVLHETMLGNMEEQLREQFGAMELSGEDLDTLVAQMMEVYASMFSNITVESIHMDMTIGKDGFMTAQDIDMVLSMDMSGIFEALGQPVDEAAAEQLKNIRMNMNTNSNYENINGDVTVEMPEFTEENTLTLEEAAELAE